MPGGMFFQIGCALLAMFARPSHVVRRDYAALVRRELRKASSCRQRSRTNYYNDLIKMAPEIEQVRDILTT